MKFAAHVCILSAALACAMAQAETATVSGGTPAAIPAVARSFIARHCIACHDDAGREAGVSLETLGDSVADASAAGWLKALAQIERGTMPPPDEEQPSADERRAAADALDAAIVAHARSRPAGNATTLRRLNRTEYRRTLEDLLHLDLSRVDPTADFPDDTRSHGFASNGEKLVTSSYLMQSYLEAAKEVVGKAVHFGQQPQVQTFAFKPPFERDSWDLRATEAQWYRDQRKPQPYQTLEYRPHDVRSDQFISVREFVKGVPTAGWYTIRVKAEGKFRYGDLNPKTLYEGPKPYDRDQPLRLAMRLGSIVGIDPTDYDAFKSAILLGPGDRGADSTDGGTVAMWDVPDDAPTWLECRVWLEAGQFPKFSFPNGPTNSDHRIQHYVNENRYVLLDKEQLATFEKANYGHPAGNVLFFETPRIRLYDIEIRGPLFETWPPPGHQAIFGDKSYSSDAAADVLTRFTERAWRRPVEAAEVEPIVALVRRAEQAAIDSGTPPQQAAEAAIVCGIRAVLCAPEFLFREERAERLDGHEIASRLSYFLWSSMPDQELLDHACSGDLVRPEVRRAQAKRLLADPRSDVFIGEFLDGWLQMQKLGSMAPVFLVYYEDKLEQAMKMETKLFFKRLLQTNGPVADFLDSDYTFVNRALAKLYRIDWNAAEPNLGKPVDGLTEKDLRADGAGDAPSLSFVPVKLTDRRRGGLLGQASVLTLTANGVDTSPVVRGAWFLEHFLGAPPSPPPPDVPIIEPDVRGTTTIRDRLQAHRDNPSCYGCHRHIDPPGFALESFDAIGRWRDNYSLANRGVPIDPSGEFRGAAFKNVVDFKASLAAQQPQFVRSLVEKLLTHALGRELDAADRPAIREIIEKAAANGYRLRDIVLLCCESDLFTQK